VRRRRVIIVLAACVLVGIGVVAFWPGEREPEYNGKKLSEWIDVAGLALSKINGDPMEQAGIACDLNNPPEVTEAVAAVRAIGTNAFPLLLKWVSDGRAPWEKTILRTCSKLPPRVHDKVASWINHKHNRSTGRAFTGFAILRKKAAPAVPKLVDIVEHSKSEDSKWMALYCLGAMKGTAQPALPNLKALVTTSNAAQLGPLKGAIHSIESQEIEF